MADGPWILVNDFKLNAYKKLMDLSADAFKLALVTSASNIAATMTPATYAALTNELPTLNGYTAGGATLASPTLTGGGAVATIDWDTGNGTITASGGNLVARWAVIYDNTAASKNIVAFCLLDSTPANYTIVDGTTLTVSIANVFSGS